jgi:hypothetical protein
VNRNDSVRKSVTNNAVDAATAKALEWLKTAPRVRDPGLTALKTDPLLDPLREEPRYKAIDA